MGISLLGINAEEEKTTGPFYLFFLVCRSSIPCSFFSPCFDPTGSSRVQQQPIQRSSQIILSSFILSSNSNRLSRSFSLALFLFVLFFS